MPKTIAEFFQFLNCKQIDAVDSNGESRNAGDGPSYNKIDAESNYPGKTWPRRACPGDLSRRSFNEDGILNQNPNLEMASGNAVLTFA